MNEPKEITMTHKELTKIIRTLIKEAGIKARVRKNGYCGVAVIQVYTWTYEAAFTEEEKRTINKIAIENGLKGCRERELSEDDVWAGCADFVVPQGFATEMRIR